MVQVQIISRILTDKSMSIVELHNIEDAKFDIYEDEFMFIKNNYHKYGVVPDKETFINKFPDFTILDVKESDNYLVDILNEEYLYKLSVPIITKVADLLSEDSNEAVQYLQSQLGNLQKKQSIVGEDIIATAKRRYDSWLNRGNNIKDHFIPSGFPELDVYTGGWKRGGELVLIFARTSIGKSYQLFTTMNHSWKNGYRVGLIEPEMSKESTGYRFDTINAHFSNTALTRGGNVVGYDEYTDTLAQSDVPIIVADTKDFDKNLTVSKIRQFIIAHKLDILGIDGITYVKDERRQRGSSMTEQLTNIAEDLMELSNELSIPIIIVSQANREGVHGDAPELENVRYSDGIAHNASIVLSLGRKGDEVSIHLKKNRNGISGAQVCYRWDIDKGIFEYLPEDISNAEEVDKTKMF